MTCWIRSSTSSSSAECVAQQRGTLLRLLQPAPLSAERSSWPCAVAARHPFFCCLAVTVKASVNKSRILRSFCLRKLPKTRNGWLTDVTIKHRASHQTLHTNPSKSSPAHNHCSVSHTHIQQPRTANSHSLLAVAAAAHALAHAAGKLLESWVSCPQNTHEPARVHWSQVGYETPHTAGCPCMLRRCERCCAVVAAHMTALRHST